MNLSELSNEKSIIFQRPYFLSAFLCFLLAVFTFGDQNFFSAQAILIIAFLLITLSYRKIKKNNNIKKSNIKFAAITSIIIFSAIMLNAIPYKGEFLLIVGFVFGLSVLARLYKAKQITAENIELLIILFAFLMYASYILYTGATIRQIDVGEVTDSENHAGYIRYLYDNWFILPDFDPRERNMFFHAPLWHMLSAFCIRILTTFQIPYVQAFEITQILSLFCAFCVIITSYRIFKIFNLRGYALVIATSLVAFCNATVMLSGSINNDIMSVAFELGAIYCALKWYKDRSIKNIVKIAFCIGLGMMTKVSVYMVAPPIAFLFIYAFFKDLTKLKKYIKQYLIFIAICAVIGLWFPVYNLIRFGVPIGYVPPAPNLYIGDYSVTQRLFDFSLYQFDSPFTQREWRSGCDYTEFNPLIALIKSTVDLQRMIYYKDIFTLPFNMVFFTTIIIGIASFVFMCFSLFSKRTGVAIENKIYMIIFYFTMMISYYIFCFKFPYHCTANIRYIYPVIIIGALFFGMLFKYKFQNKVIDKMIKCIMILLTLIFCIGSLISFMSMGTLPE